MKMQQRIKNLKLFIVAVISVVVLVAFSFFGDRDNQLDSVKNNADECLFSTE